MGRVGVGRLVVALLATAAPWGWTGDAADVRVAVSPNASTVLDDGSSEVLLDDSFEGSFPGPTWRLSHPPGAADVDWGRTTLRATDGLHSIYCAGTGPAAPGDGGPAPAGTASWAIVGPFDLSQTTAGVLSFNLWLRTEAYQDVFMWLVSTDGERFSGSARSTDTDGWRAMTADLTRWGAAGSVIGEPEVWIAFVYQSDFNNLFEGAYVDEVTLTVDVGGTGSEGRTYTSNADFSEGVGVGLESTSNQLELTEEWDALPYLWVPNSATATVSKLDTVSGRELGRYATGPNDTMVPTVAAVDLDGSCWVGNRGGGTVVKIGLLENGGCVDRDLDGEITTSTDDDGNGDITGSELLDWGDDECVLVETVLVSGSEGAHVPDDGHDDYAANGLQALAVDAAGNVWAGVRNSQRFYLLDGSDGEVLDQLDVGVDEVTPSAAAVSGDGMLWSSSWPDPWLLAIDPATGDRIRVDLAHGSAGLALGPGNGLLVTGFEDAAVSRVDTTLKEVEWSQAAYFQAYGVATGDDGRTWVVSAAPNYLTRYSPQGVSTGTVTAIGAPMGVAVDQDGKVWVLPSRTQSVFRYEPDFISFELEKPLVDTFGHDAAGDLTGILARNLTTRFGTWTVVFDSSVAGTPWGRISWSAEQPSGSSVTCRVRSSEDEESWSIWEAAGNGVDLAATPAGRYLQIQMAMSQAIGGDLPVVDEVTVAPATTVVAPVASFSWSPGSPTVGEPVSFTDTSSGSPTAWSWSFGDGATSQEQDPTHTFASAATFDVSLTVTNDAGSDTVTKPFTVAAGSTCSLACSASVPQTADVGVPVSFAATATATGCTSAVTYDWSFGDGADGAGQNPEHGYTATGTYRWTLTTSVDDVSCVAAGDITVSGAGPSECTSTLWVPAVSRSDGLNGSVWRSDLGLLGVDPGGAAVELRLHRDGATTDRVVSVAANAMVQLVDVVSWLDPAFSGSAALEVCADGELIVDSRTYNQLPAGDDRFPGATFGQHLAGWPASSALPSGETGRLGMLRENSEFRTNIGLVNTGADSATVEITLLDATGEELTSFQVVLDAGQWHQENRPLLRRAGRDDLEAASARIEVIEGAGVLAYASLIDNLTNDATTIPMR